MKQRVLAAMSGGVDSAVAALLLRQQGYEVIGITMQVWPAADDGKPGAESFGGCCSVQAVSDAKRVAALLGVPHYVLNFRKPFEERVVRRFCEEYVAGRTPNPCILCNRFMKFDLLISKAQELGADFVATGHYARIDREGGRFRLRRGLDRQKDQSYVLYSADQTVLSRVIMPLGEVQKSETRDIAHRHGLPIAAKPESQEICFVTEGDYRGFLAGKLDDLPGRGAIVNDAGERIGSHNGYVNYTVGQRRGLNLPGPEKKYVLRVDPRRNEVVVGREDQTYSTSLEADDVVFVGRDLERPARLTAMTRYNSFPATGLVTPLDNGCVRLDFERPQRAVTPGQAVVFYDGDEVVGGGTIKTGGWAASV